MDTLTLVIIGLIISALIIKEFLKPADKSDVGALPPHFTK